MVAITDLSASFSEFQANFHILGERLREMNNEDIGEDDQMELSGEKGDDDHDDGETQECFMRIHQDMRDGLKSIDQRLTRIEHARASSSHGDPMETSSVPRSDDSAKECEEEEEEKEKVGNDEEEDDEEEEETKKEKKTKKEKALTNPKEKELLKIVTLIRMHRC
ncbi:uncharacterized protein LOC131163349 [Malania oleifera]|uniref:uncharacterized protein LOC131163349 n=1 Tax=Malania oleifera TaxID=397392 RepID=UPI0025ADF1E8|nr:uncharacterized protein LOC131163349 [Malania oleifera]